MKPPKNPKRTIQFWKRHYIAFQASEGSKKAYASEKGLSYWTFLSWCRNFEARQVVSEQANGHQDPDVMKASAFQECGLAASDALHSRVTIPRPPVARSLFWRNHVSAFRPSGLSQQAYARLHGLSAKTLSRWCRKFPASTGTTEIQPNSIGATAQIVPVPSWLIPKPLAPSTIRAGLSIFLGENVRIDVSDDFSSSTLERVIQILEGNG